MSATVKDVMRTAHTIGIDSTFSDALCLMIKENTNSLLVLDKQWKLAGTVNSGSMVQAVVPNYLETELIAAHFANQDIFNSSIHKAKDIPISDIMHTNPSAVTENATLMEVSVIALSSAQFRVPVVDKDNRPIGIITRSELKHYFAEILNLDE